MRSGFTTGSCAAAASKAAAYMLLFDKEKTSIAITTPAGVIYEPEIEDITRENNLVRCAVRKDSGDDPDVTNKALIYSEVSIVCTGGDLKITIDGGLGVGRVTKPGLDQPVGNAAINHVPREMITAEVSEICREADFTGELKVIISVPEGEKIAQSTFNPRLGIVGGISIIGTSGIVEPMSMKALIATIRVELNQRRAYGYDYVAAAPGNYGRDYMERTYHYDIDRAVKCSNFIGDTIDMAAELGFKGLLLTGHIGKLIKCAGGIMNTHSREGDCRMEIMVASAIRNGISLDGAKKILDCVATEEGIRILEQEGIKEEVMRDLMERIMFNLRKRAAGRLEIDCIMYSNDFGELAKSEGADKWLTLLAQEQVPQT